MNDRDSPLRSAPQEPNSGRTDLDQEPEFTDEGPGSYLAELGTRTASVIWGGINCVMTLAIGLAAHLARLQPESEWYTVARLAWVLLPLSSALLGIVTLWQVATAYTRKSPARTLLALGLSFVGLAIWAWLKFALAVLPPVEDQP